MQYRIFQSSEKFVDNKNQKTNLVHLYINLVETFALILNLKNRFQVPLMVKVIDTEIYTTCT